MSSHTFRNHLTSIPAAIVMVAGIAIPARAQGKSAESKQQLNSDAIQNPRKAYEDREIKLEVPAWSILADAPDRRREGTLLLQKNGYTLSLAYHTGHASGIYGGRFVEIFALNWPGLDDAWTCSGYLQEIPQPASRNLIFVNVIIPTGDNKVRENCGIQKDLGSWIEKDGQKEFDNGDRRWFGGYFRDAGGGYFFGSNNDVCGLKAYTLTSQATSPERLPIADISSQNNNPALERIIQEAIDIVDSIYYKRCAPF